MRLENGDVLLDWPLAEHLLTVGNYYRGSDGTYKTWHGALDFRAAIGTPVLAAEDGTVSLAYAWNGKLTKGDTNSYGNCIKIKHANYHDHTLETLYAHLKSICVKCGQTVKAWQIIGYTGNTGNSGGAHLHFEVRYGGARKNPLCWLDNDFSAASGYIPYTYGAGECAVVRPVAKAPGTAKLQLLTIGPAPAGGAMQVWELAKKLGLTYSSKEA